MEGEDRLRWRHGVAYVTQDVFLVHDTLRRNLPQTFQWMMYTLIANIVIGIIAAVPCIGWAIAPALAIPIQGYLTAALAGLIETPLRGPVKPKRG